MTLTNGKWSIAASSPGVAGTVRIVKRIRATAEQVLLDIEDLDPPVRVYCANVISMD